MSQPTNKRVANRHCAGSNATTITPSNMARNNRGRARTIWTQRCSGSRRCSGMLMFAPNLLGTPFPDTHLFMQNMLCRLQARTLRHVIRAGIGSRQIAHEYGAATNTAATMVADGAPDVGCGPRFPAHPALCAHPSVPRGRPGLDTHVVALGQT